MTELSFLHTPAHIHTLCDLYHHLSHLLYHGLLNTHGRPTPKPRENNVEAEIHFNITEERKTVFTSGFLYLKA